MIGLGALNATQLKIRNRIEKVSFTKSAPQQTDILQKQQLGVLVVHKQQRIPKPQMIARASKFHEVNIAIARAENGAERRPVVIIWMEACILIYTMQWREGELNTSIAILAYDLGQKRQ